MDRCDGQQGKLDKKRWDVEEVRGEDAQRHVNEAPDEAYAEGHLQSLEASGTREADFTARV